MAGVPWLFRNADIGWAICTNRIPGSGEPCLVNPRFLHLGDVSLFRLSYRLGLILGFEAQTAASSSPLFLLAEVNPGWAFHVIYLLPRRANGCVGLVCSSWKSDAQS